MDGRDIFAGAAAGAVGQTVGHPLDTVKVRMQTQARKSSSWRCVLHVASEGGARAFLRGLSVPLVSKSFEQSIAFGVRGMAERGLAAVGLHGGQLRSGLSGAAAGAATAVVLTPVYLVKVQLQVTTREGLTGPFAAACQTIASRGLFGLYAGATPILVGTTIGYTFRFASYDHAVATVRQWGAGDATAVVLGGGVAGMATWASHYPLDLLSARMQVAAAVAPSNTATEPQGLLGHFREVLQHHGPRGLFRGIGPCLLLAFPV
eukprot:CAMPEP_0172664652 /NCGR_PEP_ID=MMETSP1074-20121228/6745_1 /TAXON_ID=2916 /ORGANISM="Ceratium fusus, Strain PA161109" /LENGTH=261 /DNA_ID=CAMNT_0013480847 /DNA_START=86 /DNA_END=868 /DNA_ORIENTATION=-